MRGRYSGTGGLFHHFVVVPGRLALNQGDLDSLVSTLVDPALLTAGREGELARGGRSEGRERDDRHVPQHSPRAV